MKRIVCILLAFMSLGCGVLMAASLKDQLNEGIGYYELAKDDPEGYLDKAKESFGLLVETEPLAKAYYGCLCTIEAGVYSQKGKLIKAMSLLKKGAALMDEAVKSAPDLSQVRFLRMTNSYDLSESSPINRDKYLKEDIFWLDSRKSQFKSQEQGLIELYKGHYFRRIRKIKEANAAYEACIALSPASPEAEEAEKQLATGGRKK